jgi:hypothetical protein
MKGDYPSPWIRRLEGITTVVLVLVVLAVGWMIPAAYGPAWVRLASLEAEVIVVLTLLIGALLLVSLVALLQTRRQGPSQP